MLIYLNDDYEGGELVVKDINIAIHFPKGSIILLKQGQSHYVKHIISGYKAILKGDVIL